MTRVLAGRRAVLEAIRGKTRVRRIYLERDRSSTEVREAAGASKIAVESRTRAELDALSEGTRHQGVVALAEDYPYRDLDEVLFSAGERPTLVALDQITDPQNLGAIIRSAVVFGFHGILTQKHRAAGVTAAVARASAGATEHASIVRVTNLQRTLQSLSDRGIEIVGLDHGAEADIEDLHPSSTGRVLVIGSEGHGLRRMVRERCDSLVHIRQAGPMDSLNASVAAAVAMYEVSRRLRTQGNDRGTLP